MRKRPEDMEPRELLQRIMAQQRHNLITGRIIAAALIVLVAAVIVLLPTVIGTLNDARTALNGTQQLMQRANSSIDSIDAMLEGVNGAIQDSTQSVEAVNGIIRTNTEKLNNAMEALNTIDFEGLANSITRFKAMVDALSGFNPFG